MRVANLIPLFASIALLPPVGCGSTGDSGPPATGSPTGAGGSTSGSAGTSAGSAGTTAPGGTSSLGGASSQGPVGAGGTGPGVGGAASGGKSGGSGGPSGAAGQGGASAGTSATGGSAGTGGSGVDNPTFPQLFSACVALESSTNKTTAACTGCISSMCGSLVQPEMECQSPHDTCATSCGNTTNKSCLCNCVLNLQSACGGAFKSYYWCIHKSCPQACD